MVVPSDTQKKSLLNCGIALQYLKQAGVSLLDEDGTEIIAEDVLNGEKELTLSLLWNMFVNLQVGGDFSLLILFTFMVFNIIIIIQIGILYCFSQGIRYFNLSLLCDLYILDGIYGTPGRNLLIQPLYFLAVASPNQQNTYIRRNFKYSGNCGMIIYAITTFTTYTRCIICMNVHNLWHVLKNKHASIRLM